MNLKTCLQLAKALNELSKFDRWNPSTKYMYRRISVLHYYTRTDHQVLFSSLSQYQERVPMTNQEIVLEANNMELQKSTPAVEEEHNISLKDSSKKFIRNPFTPLLLQENTQLILHKQYNRENFF